MNSLLTLIKANIINSWGINKVLKSKSKGEKIKAALLGIVIVYAFCMLFLTMFILNYPLAQVLKKMDALEVLLSSSVLSATLMSIMVSIYKIPGYLFSFRDFDLLMSLPLKPSSILTGKLIFIYLSNLMIAVMVSVPPVIVYGLETSAGVPYYAFAVIVTFFLPLVPISIGAIFAYFLGRISSRFRSTNVFLIIGSLLLCVLVIVGSTAIGQIRTEQIQSAVPVFTGLNNILFWTGFYINALKNVNILYLLAFVLFSILVFTVFTAIMAKGFKTINARMSEKYKASNYKMTRLKVSAPLKALYLKELKFYFSSFIYVTNTAIGVLMMTVFTLAAAIFGRETVAEVMEIPMAGEFITPIIVAVFAFCTGLTLITASSISLEGKNLWIVKSLPISIKNILRSKVLVNLTLTAPAVLINTVIAAIAFGLQAGTAAAILVVSLLYCLFPAVAGLMVNLYFPKLEWTTHTAVVKQSASVILSMVISFISIIIPAVLFILIKPAGVNGFLWILSVALAAADIIMIKILNTAGLRKFTGL